MAAEGIEQACPHVKLLSWLSEILCLGNDESGFLAKRTGTLGEAWHPGEVHELGAASDAVREALAALYTLFIFQ